MGTEAKWSRVRLRTKQISVAITKSYAILGDEKVGWNVKLERE